MADNYIEKQQELYEARKAAGNKHRNMVRRNLQPFIRSNRLRVLQWPQNQRPPPKEYL